MCMCACVRTSVVASDKVAQRTQRGCAHCGRVLQRHQVNQSRDDVRMHVYVCVCVCVRVHVYVCVCAHQCRRQ